MSRGSAAIGRRLWTDELRRDWRASGIHIAHTRAAHSRGFTVPVFDLIRRSGREIATVISQREYHSLYPLNAASPWLANRIVTARTLPGLSLHMAEAIAVVARGRDDVVFTSLRDEPVDHDFDWLLELVRERETVRFVSMAWGRGPGVLISWSGEEYAFDGESLTPEQLHATLLASTADGRFLITRPLLEEGHLARMMDADKAFVRLFVGRGGDDPARVLDADVVIEHASTSSPAERWAEHAPVDRSSGRIGDGTETITGFRGVVAEVERILSDRRARFSFITVDITLGDGGRFTMVEIVDRPSYPRAHLLSEEASSFLLDLHAARRSGQGDRISHPSLARRTWRRIDRLRRRTRAFALRASGFTGAAARSWVWLTERDRSERIGFSSREIAQAHQWGFTAATVADFEISAANLGAFISIRDYLYAQPVNGRYAKWIRDRVSALMVFKPFENLFDTVHYQVFRRGSDLHIVPISAEARRAGVAVDDIAGLLSQSGDLLLAATSWRDTEMLRIGYRGSAFLIDGIACAPGEFLEVLRWAARYGSQVLLKVPDQVGEGAPDLRVEVIMLNADGAHPVVAEAFAVVREEYSAGADAPVRYRSRIDPESGAYEGGRAVVDRRVNAFDNDPVSGEPFGGTVPGWRAIVESLTLMGAFAPQLRFVQFTLTVSATGWRIRSASPSPRYSVEHPFQPHTVDFIRESIEGRRSAALRPGARLARGLHNAKLKIRREYAAAFYPKGLLPYQSTRWPGDVRRDLLQRNGIPLKTKLWAYRRGYLSYRIPQYGITEANRHQFISDFEYRWLRHINEHYKYWLEDKVSIKYVAADFNEYLPDYYFYTTRSHGRNHVVPMMDCPEGYGSEYDDVLRLAREKGALALKPDEGSHGEGFYRLGWDDGAYSLNGEVVGEEAVIDLLTEPRNRYLITEYIEMHPAIAQIYPHSVNTIRMIVFKRDGITPQIGSAYLRIGSSASGYVDNIAAGGMMAEIDLASGRFGNAQTLVRGRVEPCPRHPDTGVLIEGVLPNWDHVKKQILRMAESFSQLEYLGFDVALTTHGFKIPEINRFPDFPRIDRLGTDTVDYLFHKLDQKKRRFGYDIRRPHSLVSLPRREAR